MEEEDRRELTDGRTDWGWAEAGFQRRQPFIEQAFCPHKTIRFKFFFIVQNVTNKVRSWRIPLSSAGGFCFSSAPCYILTPPRGESRALDRLPRRSRRGGKEEENRIDHHLKSLFRSLPPLFPCSSWPPELNPLPRPVSSQETIAQKRGKKE